MPAPPPPVTIATRSRNSIEGDHGTGTRADNGKAVRRFVSAIAFLATLAVVLLAAGCGQRFDRGNAPAPADLAADALAALEEASSAHFVADVRTESSGDPFSFSVHVEGDASATALDARGSVNFGSIALTGRVLADEHSVFVEFMNSWYGDQSQGIADALGEAKEEHDGQIWEELATPEGLRRNFGQLFEGEVTEGPVVDGVATWQFEGRFNADGIVDFARRYEAEPSEKELDEFRLVADASRFVLVVGQADHLPRRLELSMELPEEARQELEEGFNSADSFRGTLELSEFGKPVEIEAPADFKPFDQLFEDLFGSFE
jgi:hypothetical protein